MEWIRPLLKELISLKLFLPFIPLFVAFDVLGILPIFVSFTMEMDEPERKRVVRQSILTALLISIGFLLVGKSVFALLNITVSDFKVAGGILLFIIAVVDLIFPERTRTFPKETIGVVPIGIPLIVGPGVPHLASDHRGCLRLSFVDPLFNSQSFDCLAGFQLLSPADESF